MYSIPPIPQYFTIHIKGKDYFNGLHMHECTHTHACMHTQTTPLHAHTHTLPLACMHTQ
jgi:hypothetical protein